MLYEVITMITDAESSRISGEIPIDTIFLIISSSDFKSNDLSDKSSFKCDLPNKKWCKYTNAPNVSPITDASAAPNTPSYNFV